MSDLVRRSHSASGDRGRREDDGHCSRAATRRSGLPVRDPFEAVSVKTFIAEATVETRDKRVLDGLPGTDEIQLDAAFCCKADAPSPARETKRPRDAPSHHAIQGLAATVDYSFEARELL